MSVLDCCSSPDVHLSVVEALAPQSQNANASLVLKLVCRTQARVSVSANWHVTVAANASIDLCGGQDTDRAVATRLDLA